MKHINPAQVRALECARGKEQEKIVLGEEPITIITKRSFEHLVKRLIWAGIQWEVDYRSREYGESIQAWLVIKEGL